MFYRNGFLARSRSGKPGGKSPIYYWHIIKHNNNGCGVVPTGNISFPKNMIGKKVYLQVVVKDE